MPVRRVLLALIVSCPVLVGLGAPPLAHAERTSGEVVAALNALRAAHGLPAGVVERPTLSAGCLAHNQWMAANRTIAHAEMAGTPAYSALGDATARISVLSMGATWEHGSPWLNAPLHLSDVLMPQLRETGASEADGFSCLVTHTQANLRTPQPATLRFWAYPRSGARLPATQTADEAPAPPQTFGVRPIRRGVPTGPNLLTFLRGPVFAGGRRPLLVGAVLIGPRGVRVPVMTVNERQLAQLPQGAGVVVPRLPLQPGVRYAWRATYAAPRTRTLPAWRWTSPTRTFTATDQHLCGFGVGGWLLPGTCPVSVRALAAPRIVTVAAAASRGIRVGVVLDGPGWAGGVLKSGRRTVGVGSTSVGATRRGSMLIRPSAAGLLRALGTRRSVALTIEAKSSSLLVRRMRVTITR